MVLIIQNQNIIENLMSPQINDPRGRKKIPRSVWMPALLLVYLFGMTAWFAPSLIAQGEVVRLVVVFVSELIIIAVLRWFLVKRENQKRN